MLNPHPTGASINRMRFTSLRIVSEDRLAAQGDVPDLAALQRQRQVLCFTVRSALLFFRGGWDWDLQMDVPGLRVHDFGVLDCLLIGPDFNRRTERNGARVEANSSLVVR